MSNRDTVILYNPKIDFLPYYPCFWAPIAIIAIAAPLVDSGYKVILLDGNLEQDELRVKQTIIENLSNILFVGITSMVGGKQLERGIALGRNIRLLSKTIPVVFGGGMPTIASDILLTEDSVDYVICGQGEVPITKLAACLRDGSNPINIEGVYSRTSGGIPQPVFEDRSDFSKYPWHLVDVESYLRNDPYLGKRILNYISSQGCPYQCGYCSEPVSCRSKWTAYPAERTYEETRGLVEKYGLDGIKFYDANFFINPRRVVDFAQLILGNSITMRWGASAHPKGLLRLSEELKLIKRSGLSRLLIGAESGSQKVLDFIKKGCTVNDNLKAAEICKKYDIAAAFTFIVGFPGIDENIEETLSLVSEMKKINIDFDIKIHFYSPFPGTNLYPQALIHGYKPPMTLEEWSRHDYYQIQTPWMDKDLEVRICDFMAQLSGR